MKALISLSILACVLVGGLQAHNLVLQDSEDPNEPGQERIWVSDDPNEPGQERTLIAEDVDDPNTPGQERSWVSDEPEEPNEPGGGE